MKTTLLILGLMLASTLGFAQNVIRVQNGQDIESIIGNVSTIAGSVLLLDPGSYAGFTVNKRVSIIGSGYFNGNNVSTITGTVTFSGNNNTSSDNSLIMGCNAQGISVNRANITIQRCRVNSGFTGISIGGVNNCRVVQCFAVGGIGINGSATNTTIQNNIVLGYISNPFITGNASGRIFNNTVGKVIDGICNPLDIANTVNGVEVFNNIFLSPETCDNRNARENYPTTQYARFTNNIIRQGNYQANNTNTALLDMTGLFVGSGTADSQHMLSANSPAKGAGEGGTDCGAFGGADPYVLTGSPIGPIIQDLQVPTTARQNETIQIRLRAKIQN